MKKHKATYLCHGEHYENFSYYFAIKQIAKIARISKENIHRKVFPQQLSATKKKL